MNLSGLQCILPYGGGRRGNGQARENEGRTLGVNDPFSLFPGGERHPTLMLLLLSPCALSERVLRPEHAILLFIKKHYSL